MQKFRFRLDSVLRLRAAKLASERDKLSKALGAVTQAEQAIADLATERAAAVAFVQNEAGAGTTELRSLAAYLLGYNTRLTQLEKILEAARLRAAQQRQCVVAADRDERLLVKLKEKQRTEWQHEADKELEILAQESWNSVHFDRES